MPVAQSDLALALLDAFPVSGHASVITRRHVGSYLDCTREEQRAIWELVGNVCARLEAERHPNGFDIAISAGGAANGTVAHTHCHVDVTPRFQGDPRGRPGGLRKTLPPRAH